MEIIYPGLKLKTYFINAFKFCPLNNKPSFGHKLSHFVTTVLDFEKNYYSNQQLKFVHLNNKLSSEKLN